MADIYGNYSRRGLIEMNTEFDTVNDEALSQFVSGKDYEGVRAVEKMIDSADKVSASLKNVVGESATAIVDKMSLSMNKFVDEIAASIKEAHESIVEEGN